MLIRALLLTIALIASGPAGAAEDAERIAASLWRALSMPDPEAALDALKTAQATPDGKFKIATFTHALKRKARRRHRSAVMHGNCREAQSLEFSGFLKLFPHFRDRTLDKATRAKLEQTVFSFAEDAEVCVDNKHIAGSIAALDDLTRAGLPLRFGNLDKLPWQREWALAADDPVHLIEISLALLEKSAICDGNAAALESLLRYTNAPPLIALAPEHAIYLFARASAQEIDITRAALTVTINDPLGPTHADRERITIAAIDNRQFKERAALEEWERGCLAN